MKIAHIAGESAPFVQTGGLGTFMQKLAEAQSRAGHSVSVCIPYYLLTDKSICNIEDTGIKVNISAGDKEYIFTVFRAVHNGVDYIFLENAELFGRGGIYSSGDLDYADNDLRYAAFSQATLFFFAGGCIRPDIIHCHDWQTGLVPLYNSLLFRDMEWKTVFTIHDVQYQGIFHRMDLYELNIPQEFYDINGIEFYGQISFLKAGIIYSDVITTVSHAYARDIQTESIAGGMAGVIAGYSYKLKGVLSGIDYNIWNAENDPYLPKPQSIDKDWKREHKKELADIFGIDPERPIILMIGRMSSRKGIELLADAAPALAERDASFFVFGYGDKFYARIIKKLSESFGNFYTNTKYETEEAHKLFAAADFVLAPSVYAPFGTSHLLGSRYGAVPIINPSGGIEDTIKPFVDNKLAFVLKEYTADALVNAVDEAIEFYSRADSAGMVFELSNAVDFSWEKSAAQYYGIYMSISGEGL